MSEIEAVRKKIGKLELLVKSLITCLVESGQLDPEALKRIQDDLDMLDGVADGEMRLD